MREVVHGVDAPGIASAVMGRVQDAVHDRIAHIDVWGGHVDFGPQSFAAIREFACAHAFKQIKILLNRAVAPGAVLAGLGQSSAVLPHLIRTEFIHVSKTLFDQLQRHLVEGLKVIRGIIFAVTPIKPQPMDIFFDGIDIFHVFFYRIGVIVAQVGQPAIIFSHAEVNAESFGMTNMQIAVGFRWKAGMHPPAKPASAIVFINNFTNEIGFC